MTDWRLTAQKGDAYTVGELIALLPKHYKLQPTKVSYFSPGSRPHVIIEYKDNARNTAEGPIAMEIMSIAKESLPENMKKAGVSDTLSINGALSKLGQSNTITQTVTFGPNGNVNVYKAIEMTPNERAEKAGTGGRKSRRKTKRVTRKKSRKTRKHA